MTDVVHAHGRRMSKALASALDDLTGSRREHVIAALSESRHPALRRLYDALVVELRLAEMREAAILAELEPASGAVGFVESTYLSDGASWWPEDSPDDAA